ncbi:hypothetical protein EDB85DRAFT_1179064 [Lactarius pseudohatsudake]|nr:hypothetical protein EDB85DRAFT_1179064 [Lactarius pseudohatsudake]
MDRGDGATARIECIAGGALALSAMGLHLSLSVRSAHALMPRIFNRRLLQLHFTPDSAVGCLDWLGFLPLLVVACRSLHGSPAREVSSNMTASSLGGIYLRCFVTMIIAVVIGKLVAHQPQHCCRFQWGYGKGYGLQIWAGNSRPNVSRASQTTLQFQNWAAVVRIFTPFGYTFCFGRTRANRARGGASR